MKVYHVYGIINGIRFHRGTCETREEAEALAARWDGREHREAAGIEEAGPDLYCRDIYGVTLDMNGATRDSWRGREFCPDGWHESHIGEHRSDPFARGRSAISPDHARQLAEQARREHLEAKG